MFLSLQSLPQAQPFGVEQTIAFLRETRLQKQANIKSKQFFTTYIYRTFSQVHFLHSGHKSDRQLYQDETHYYIG